MESGIEGLALDECAEPSNNHRRAALGDFLHQPSLLRAKRGGGREASREKLSDVIKQAIPPRYEEGGKESFY